MSHQPCDDDHDTTHDIASLTAILRTRTSQIRRAECRRQRLSSSLDASTSLNTSPSGTSFAVSSDGKQGPVSSLSSARPSLDSGPTKDDIGMRSIVNASMRKRRRRYKSAVSDEKLMVGLFEENRYVLRPDRGFRQWWDMYLLVLLVYVALVSVFVYSFFGVLGTEGEGYSAWFWIERFLDVSFAVDIVLNFFTAFEKNGRFVTHLPSIRRRYLTTWFIWDVLATLPWDFIAISTLDTAEAKSSPHLLQLPRFIRLVRLFKFFRLLRLLRLKGSFTRLEVRLRLKYGYFRMASLFATVILVAHWIACLFYYFGAVSDRPDSDPTLSTSGSEPNSWVDNWIGGSLYERYIVSLYFSVYTITTIGYGDVVPINPLERTYTTIIMILGAACFTFMISQLTDITKNFNASSAEHRNMMDSLTDLAKSRHLPYDLVYEIRRYFQKEHARQQVALERELLKGMSGDLRVKVFKHVYGTQLETSRLFRNIPANRLTHAYENVSEGFFRKEETLFETGDTPDCFYIIIDGKVEIFEPSVPSTVLSNGDIFGENDILFGRARQGTAVCKAHTEMLMVPRTAVMETLKRHPQVLKKLRDEEAFSLWEDAICFSEQQIHFQRMTSSLLAKAEANRRAQGLATRPTAGDSPLSRTVVTAPAATSEGVGSAGQTPDAGPGVGSGAGLQRVNAEKNRRIAEVESRLLELQQQLDSIVATLKSVV